MTDDVLRDQWLDERPIVVAVAGPNGAGKTTFFHAHLARAGLRFVNADVLARGLRLEPYDAARAADDVRRALVRQRESFVFETVFSDPVGDKLAFLDEAAEAGYTVGLIFIGIDSALTSETRVAMRVSQGGHDVPHEKLIERFPRTLKNLEQALRTLPHGRHIRQQRPRNPLPARAGSRIRPTTQRGCRPPGLARGSRRSRRE